MTTDLPVFPAPQPGALFISNGTAEDLIGAAIAARLRGQVRLTCAPLVGSGAPYARAGVRRIGRTLPLPSGGFPLGSVSNLAADLKAGLIRGSLGQWRDAARGARDAQVVVVVGDAYALMVGTLAAQRGRARLVHVQPLLSAQYLDGLSLRGTLAELNALGANRPMEYELALARRADAVFVRDAATARHYARRGVPATFAGSFAMDVLPAPEGPLPLDGRPVLALLPGSREDHRESLPLMLRAAAHLPGWQALVAWSHGWDDLTLPGGWTFQQHLDGQGEVTDGTVRVQVLRGAFGAVAHAAQVAIGTAGTANEQLAGLGVPVVAFPTRGPQFTEGFARRQGRLLGRALTVVPAEVQAVARAVERVTRPEALARAALDGMTRIGPAGALPRVAARILELAADSSH
ncbi:lipid-A-disaccharide synthase-related protein [Deinococcus depolymerans]|uniref:Lipid-A-disaccharide synthase-related protein n=1 Tax=Deinococcus depolymerans TaxID=392408 RepID=A0ABN1CLR8_9DEIO